MKSKSMFLAVALLTATSSFAQQTWTLQECISHAVAHNLTIKQQELNVKQQEITLNTSQSSRLPDLNGSVGENFSFGRALTSDNTYANRNTQSTSFSLSTSVPLITGGRLPADVKVKRLNLQAAIQDCEKAREDVTLNVISSFLEAVYQKDLVEVAQHQVELSQMQVERVQKLFENGKSSESDLAQIKATHASDELSLTQQTNTYKLALLTLSQLLELETPEGFDVARPSTGDQKDVVLPSPDVVYNEAIGVKPQIQAEQLRLQSAEKSILVARSAYFPSLSFQAGIGTSYYKTSGYQASPFRSQMRDNFNQYMGLSLSVPIFNRFSTRNSVRAARLQVMTQQIQLDETKKTLYKDIQQAYYNAVAALRQCESSDVALSSAQVAFELMQKKYENGKATATEFQESKTALSKASADLIQARYTSFFRQKILDFYRGRNI